MNRNSRYQGRHSASAKKPDAAPKKPAKKTKTPLLALGIALAVVVAAAACGYAYVAPALKYKTIYPNVYVAGVNVGGMTKVEAKQAVEATIDSTYGTETLKVNLPDRVLEFPPELTRVTVNTDTAIDEAWRYGRDGGMIAKARALRAADDTEYRIDLKTDLDLDTDAIRAKIEKAAESLDGKPVQTRMDLDEDNHQLTVTMGASGKSLDVDALYDAVYERFLASDFTPFDFDYATRAPDAANLQKIYDQIAKSAKDAYLDEETGEIVAEQNGYGFDVAAAQQRLAMAKEGEVVTIALETIAPEVTQAKLQETYFRDVLAAYDSPHVYNPNRTNNLKLAAEAINGTVVMPGKEFSFNETVGQRTEAKGYLEATVYVSGASVGETGGGVCQVASTIYYCSLLANLEITEREEHMYAVDYVPHGMDATIYWGQHDYRFRNNTDYPIRIESSVYDGYVHVRLIGTKTDDTYVKMTSELLSTTSWKTVDEDKRELTAAPEYGENVYLCKDDEQYYESVEVVETAYTGYIYYTYRNVYKGDGTLISSNKEDKTTYMKRDRTLKVVLMDPQPGEEPEPEPEDPPEYWPTEGDWPTDPDAPLDPVIDPDVDPLDEDPGPEPEEYWP